MGASITVQSAAAVTENFGTLTIGPFTVTGTIVPVALGLALASGNNSFTVPSGAVGAVVSPPAGNAIALKAKTTTGDTGINIPQQTPSVFFFDTANLPATFYINAGSSSASVTQVIFF